MVHTVISIASLHAYVVCVYMHTDTQLCVFMPGMCVTAVEVCTYLHVLVDACVQLTVHTYIPVNAHMHSDTVLTFLLVWSLCSVSRFYRPMEPTLE